MSGWANHTLSPSTRRQLDTQNKAANRKAPQHQTTVTATAKLTSDNGRRVPLTDLLGQASHPRAELPPIKTAILF
ncbi:MAG: hypothetical protein D4R63_13095 [Methylococcaceae bacterium]|nr:MAG: hypothetical protein D4R63_13095 [Methylococcaceae bacterium]